MNSDQSTRYRVLVLVLTLLGGTICAGVLAVTSWKPVNDVPAAPANLFNQPQYAADVKLPLTSFYDWPNPLPQVASGTILKQEPIEGAPAGLLALRIMYMSSDVKGNPVPITGAYFERTSDRAPVGGRALMGFSHGTSGLAPFCGMSQAPFVPGTTGAQFFGPEMKPLIDAGYAVVATDYQNMGAKGTPSYLVQQSEAYAVLDSVRAALNLFPNNLNGAKLGLIGHSQGGQASLAAAQYRDAYAPELNFQGVVSQAPGMVVGLPVVMKGLVAGGDPASAAKRAEYVSFIADSWSATYPDQMSAGEVLTPAGLALQPEANELCGPTLRDAFTGPLSDYVKSELPTSFLRLANLNVPDGAISFPLLMTQGLQDEAVVPQMSIATFRAICRTGTVGDLRIYENDTHNSLLWTAQPAYVNWLNDRMAGKPAPNSCEGRQ